MLRFISNYPISRRLIIAFVLAAIFPSVIIAFMGVYYVNQLNGRGLASASIANAQTHTYSLSSILQHTYTETRSVETQVLSSALDPSDHAVSSTVTQTAGQAATDLSNFSSQLSTYESQYDLTRSPNVEQAYAMLNSIAQNNNTPQVASDLLHSIMAGSWPTYRTAQQTELTLLQKIHNSPGSFSAHSIVTQVTKDSDNLNKAYSSLYSNWLQLIGYINKISTDLNGVNSSETQPITISTVGAFLLTIFIVITAGILVLRSITGPLTELISLTKRISKGDTNARAHVTSHDEIAIVANAMNNMLDNIVHLIQDTQAQRDVLQGQVEKLVSEVSGVGEGDLRVQAEVTADALGVLADSFNYMVEELGSLVVRVKMVAREVEESTTMTSDRMNELVETADRQIQQIANAGLEIERMAMTSQQVAGRALALASSAREARLSAQGGRQAVQQTVEGMGRIHSNVQETSGKVQTLGERSREINNIVEAISNIAHQTNRLALDAAIQAAMAGDNGKGFGAVAADIRRLAERAKEQATSVGRIVRSVRDDIGAVAVSMRDTERETSAGAKLAAEAGTSLESIFTVIERQAREIEIINQMAMQQQQSSNEVVQIMQGVSESTQESTNSTRDAAQNMERVSRLAEQLLASVEAFRLRENLNYFAPNANASSLPGEKLEGPLTASGVFRTVTSTVQPISNGGLYNALPLTASGDRFSQYPEQAPAFYAQGGGNGQPLFLPQGHSSFQPNSGDNPQQALPAWGNDGVQEAFPSQRAMRVPQRPTANDWQSPGDWKQSDWQ